MASIKRDAVKQAWETGTEFPLVCETCLGDNPYVRMTMEAHGKKCQVCENPFTVFAWQAGTKGRLKRVEICKSCAQAKNVCQVCIYDLQYGLPVKVRDRVLRESGSSSAIAAMPQSNANRAWFTAQQQRALANGEADTNNTNVLAHAKLQDMARMEPCYERNLPKLCSFFAKGECDRGSNCPFRHEMPRDRNDPMSKQNTKDRFYGTNDPVANKIIGRKRRQEQEQKSKVEEEGYDMARATIYIRFQGEAPYPQISEMDIRDAFYSFGEIVAVRSQAEKGQAFVEYTQTEAANLAIVSMNRKELASRPIFTSWARAVKRGDPLQRRNDDTDVKSGASFKTSSSNTAAQPEILRPAPPPGGGSASTAKELPKGLFTAIRPSAEVMAVAGARRQQQQATTKGGTNTGVAARPYYPSADPNRLGSKTTATAPPS